MYNERMYNVIFDMDGVIFDSEKAQLDCWMEVSADNGLDGALVRSTYMKCIGTNFNQSTEIYLSAFRDILTEEKLKSIWDESIALYRQRYADGDLPVKKGVIEILEYLRSSGIPAGIASSTRLRTVEREIRNAGLYDYFVGFVGGDAVKISKPNPEIYLLACRQFGFEPGRTFAIEDSYNGIRAAHAAGMRPVMVPDLIPADEEMKRLAEVICSDLTETKEYLKKSSL